MNCQQAQELMLQFVEHELQPEMSAALEAHLATCDACQHEAADLQVFSTGFGRRYRADLDRLSAPPQAWDALQARLASRTAPDQAALRPRMLERARTPTQHTIGTQPMLKRSSVLNLVAFGLIAVLVIAVIVALMPRQSGGGVAALQPTDAPSQTPSAEAMIITVIVTSEQGNPVVITATPPPVASPFETIFSLPGYEHILAISPDGEWMLVSNRTRGGPRSLYLARIDGSESIPLFPGERYYKSAAWSPNGREIVIEMMTDGDNVIYDLYSYDLETELITQLTNHGAYETGPMHFDSAPKWSPDGARIAYISQRSYQLHLYVMNADGSGQTQISGDLPIAGSFEWSPDGSRIAFASYDGEGEALLDADLNVINADGSGLQVLAEGIYAMGLSWSPDSTQLVYAQIDRDAVNEENPYGTANLYTVDVATHEAQQLTTDPAHDAYPAWSPDGQYIAFTSDRDGDHFDMWLIRPDGSDLRKLDNPVGVGTPYPYWLPDSQSLMTDLLIPYIEYLFSSDRETDIYRIDLADFVPVNMEP